MARAFVFDLDGTLVDSLPGIAQGLNAALESLNHATYTEQEIRAMVGKGARDLCCSALAPFYGGDKSNVEDRDIKALLAAFMKFYPETWQRGTVIYPGITSLLQELQEQQCLIAVLSNKPHSITEPLVRHIFPDIRFSPVMGYGDRFPRKPDPSSLLYIADLWGKDIQELMMIGDSVHDASTAQNAGSKLALVSWGYNARKSLEQYNAPLFDQVGQLHDYLINHSL